MVLVTPHKIVAHFRCCVGLSRESFTRQCRENLGAVEWIGPSWVHSELCDLLSREISEQCRLSRRLFQREWMLLKDFSLLWWNCLLFSSFARNACLTCSLQCNFELWCSIDWRLACERRLASYRDRAFRGLIRRLRSHCAELGLSFLDGIRRMVSLSCARLCLLLLDLKDIVSGR